MTIDCADPQRLTTFWSALLGRPVSNEHPDAGWASVGSRHEVQPRLTFQAAPEPKTTEVRLHLDVQVDDIELARREVEELGGRWSWQRHHFPEGVVMVMAGTEGHEI